MSVQGELKTRQEYLELLDRLEKHGLVEGIPSWSAIVPRDRIRVLPVFSKEEISPGTVPKDHPSLVRSYFSPDHPAMQAMKRLPDSLNPEGTYRVMPPGSTCADVLSSLREEMEVPSSQYTTGSPLSPASPPSPASPQTSQPQSKRIPGIIGARVPQLNDFLPESLLSSIGFSVAGNALKDRVANITPAGYQANPHVDLMEVVLAVGTTTKLWILYKTPAADVKGTIIRESMDTFDLESMRRVLSTWTAGPFYIVLQRPGDLLIVPSGWWHFVETLTGGVLSGIETFLAQGFNIQQNVAHLEAEFDLALPRDPALRTASHQDVQDAVGYFWKLVQYTSQLLDQDKDPWPFLRSVTGALQSLKKMLVSICESFKESVLSFTFLKSQCDTLKSLLRKLSGALKSAIERANEVIDERGICATLRACKWEKGRVGSGKKGEGGPGSDEVDSNVGGASGPSSGAGAIASQSGWVSHCLNSQRHYPLKMWLESLDDVIAFKSQERKRKLAESRDEQRAQREESRARATEEPVRRSKRLPNH
ncbi:hypothetical protein TWF730_001761 [Orbilia blumenaviensis]|uniref:JmjC domain-containing protein n=1 Tax=Orbilia blumenaviensis TaxID=1796055 RepID=A0AAV9UN13_9PEZI